MNERDIQEAIERLGWEKTRVSVNPDMEKVIGQLKKKEPARWTMFNPSKPFLTTTTIESSRQDREDPKRIHLEVNGESWTNEVDTVNRLLQKDLWEGLRPGHTYKVNAKKLEDGNLKVWGKVQPLGQQAGHRDLFQEEVSVISNIYEWGVGKLTEESLYTLIELYIEAKTSIALGNPGIKQLLDFLRTRIKEMTDRIIPPREYFASVDAERFVELLELLDLPLDFPPGSWDLDFLILAMTKRLKRDA